SATHPNVCSSLTGVGLVFTSAASYSYEARILAGASAFRFIQYERGFQVTLILVPFPGKVNMAEEGQSFENHRPGISNFTSLITMQSAPAFAAHLPARP